MRDVSKVRGYIAIGAGIFLIVLMAGLYIFFGNLAASGSMTLPAGTGAAFFGKLYVGFGLLAISGAVGIANGLWIVRRQKINVALTIIALLVAASAIGCIWQASQILPA
jgi:hypothetical protein